MNQLKGNSITTEVKRIFLPGVIIPFLMAWFFLVPPLFASDQTDDAAIQTLEGKAEQESSGLQKQQRWAAFPIIGSNPEVGVMLGGMLFHFFPVTTPGQQASTIDLVAYVTTNEQYSLSLSPNIFFDDDTYRLNASLFGSYWQANYYGIGNDSPDVSEQYESTNVGANITLERRFFDSLLLDFIGLYESEDLQVEAGGMLSSGNIPGTGDNGYVGIGLAGGYDTRDNTNAPAAGHLARYEYIKYDKDIGSDLDFSIQTWDLRHYQRVFRNSVLAFAANMRNARGEVPFRYLSSPDGTMILRGIENGRYRDNNLLAFQLEYRFPIKRKFSGTAFVEAAQVAHELKDMEAGGFKYSFGGGLRYALNSEQRFNIRFDIAWVDNKIDLVVSIREAF